MYAIDRMKERKRSNMFEKRNTIRTDECTHIYSKFFLPFFESVLRDKIAVYYIAILKQRCY